MSVDTGESDARKTVIGSADSNELVFAKHRERIKELLPSDPLELQGRVKKFLNEDEAYMELLRGLQEELRQMTKEIERLEEVSR